MKKLFRLGFSIVEIIIVITFLVIISGVGYKFWVSMQSKSNEQNDGVSSLHSVDSKSNANDSQTAASIDKITLAENIYFEDNGSLYGVNIKTKNVKKIDDNLSSGYGGLGAGVETPLNSFDFSKVAYVKNREVYIYDGTNSTKINQPDTTGKAHHSYLISWSPDTKFLVYRIQLVYLLGEVKPSGPNVDGVYLYSLESGKSVKLPIETAVSWVPGSSKIAYLKDIEEDDDIYETWTYDIASGKNEILSKSSISNVSQIEFSYDGSKILYNTYDRNSEVVRIIIANIDNSNQSTVLSGRWADVQSHFFVKYSDSSIVYQKQETTSCNGRTVDHMDGSCYVNYLMVSGDDTKYEEVERVFGPYDENNVIVATHSIPESSYTPKLMLVNLKTGGKTVLYNAVKPYSINLSVLNSI